MIQGSFSFLVNRVGGIWKGVLEAEVAMRCGVKRTVGRGEWFRFWVDKWIGNSAPCLSSPDLFRVVASPSGMFDLEGIYVSINSLI